MSTQTAGLPRILVVDDSRIVRATVRKHLSGSFDLIEEVDGEAGWERLVADETVQLLISDLTMPRLDGFGLLARVRKAADVRIKHTPVIIISGEEDPETRQLALERGATDFITKSTDRAEMLARVNAALSLARAARERAAVAVAAAASAPDAVHQPAVAAAPVAETPTPTDGHRVGLPALHASGGLLLLALDGAETLRQKLGEAVATQLWAMLAKVLAARLRRGEQMVESPDGRFWLASESAPEALAVLAERLRHTVAATKVSFRGEPVTLSASIVVGAPVVEAGQVDETATLQAFDAALQGVQAAGGNRVQQLGVEAVAVSVDAALARLAAGDVATVRAALPALLARLAPLLALVEKP
jgi:DNA-binding response OmpR family regulator/GGDEF domain-containing protein